MGRTRFMIALAVALPLVVPSAANPAVASSGTLFYDGFESGGMSAWTLVKGVTTQQTDVRTGAWAATAQAAAAPAFAKKRLATSEADVDFAADVKVTARGSNPVSLTTTRTNANTGIAGLFATAGGKLALRNFVSGVTSASRVSVADGRWHRLVLRVHIAGSNSRVDVWMDGAQVDTLTSTASLGTTGVGYSQIGDAAKTRSFTVIFDNVDVEAVVPDTTPPSTPAGLTANPVSSSQVDLNWDPATDDVGVIGYVIYRDGAYLASQGPSTSFSDTTVSPATSYSYQVAAQDAAGNTSPLSSPAVAVTPPPPPADDPVIAAAGDIACAPTDPNFNSGAGTSTFCRQQATADAITSIQPTRVLALGDTQYEVGALSAYQGSYDLSWGVFKAITSPAIGNHEYGTPGAAGYFDYFGEAAGDPATGYYSYDIGAWHLIALNSECTQLPAGSGVDGCAEGSPQNDWLETDLATHPALCTLAYWHEPRFSSGAHGSGAAVAPFWDDLYAAGADVVLSGHEHDYERLVPVDPAGVSDPTAGIREFIVGTGGRSLRNFTTAQPATTAVRQGNTSGVLSLSLHLTTYDWRFVRGSGGTFTDVGSGACH